MNLLCVDLVNKFFTFTMFPFIRLRQSGGSLIYESIKKNTCSVSICTGYGTDRLPTPYQWICCVHTYMVYDGIYKHTIV